VAKWNRARFWSRWLDLHGFLFCELAGHERGCSSGFEAHHIIPRHLIQGNKKALAHIHKHSHIFLSCLCPAHHAIASTWAVRYKLLDARVLLFGKEAVATAITKLLDLMKSDIPELHRYLGE
jgi:hypothetical protein